MKKKILFVIDSLNIGGAEKSLVNLLNLIDPQRYSIDLKLFSRGGDFEKQLPDHVRILPEESCIKFLNLPLIKQIKNPFQLFSRLIFSLRIRLSSRLNSELIMLYWQQFNKYFQPGNEYYDYAIAFSQGVPTYYVNDKIKAFKKLAWLNVPFIMNKKSFKFNRSYYNGFDKIVLVSNYLKKFWNEKLYPEQAEKLYVIYDIINDDSINKLASQVEENIKENDRLLIVTVCRLDMEYKGLDLLLAAAKILKENGIKFMWYVIGEGDARKEMEEYIRQNNLEDYIKLPGRKDNPYSFIKQCDIYVQTSRREGFGLTVAEAKILKKPIVCTAFSGSETHITDGENGLLSGINSEEIAGCIMRLANDKELREKFIRNLEIKDNQNEIEKFYSLLEN